MKQCPRCAAEITSKMKKCDKCGMPLDKVDFSDEIEKKEQWEYFVNIEKLTNDRKIYKNAKNKYSLVKNNYIIAPLQSKFKGEKCIMNCISMYSF